jgi:hypothetical protein
LHLFVRPEEAGLVKNGIILFPFMQHILPTRSTCHWCTQDAQASIRQQSDSLERPHIFEMADRAALVGIAGSDVIAHLRRRFI